MNGPIVRTNTVCFHSLEAYQYVTVDVRRMDPNGPSSVIFVAARWERLPDEIIGWFKTVEDATAFMDALDEAIATGTPIIDGRARFRMPTDGELRSLNEEPDEIGGRTGKPGVPAPPAGIDPEKPPP